MPLPLIPMIVGAAVGSGSYLGYENHEKIFNTKSHAVEIVAKEEGFRSKAYKDILGYLTIGHGFLLSKANINPDDILVELDEDLSKVLLEYRVNKIEKTLSSGKYSRVYNKLSRKRKDVLISMAYQMGIKGLYSFKKMWKALEADDKPNIINHAIDSRWYRQTPKRAMSHAITLADIKKVE